MTDIYQDRAPRDNRHTEKQQQPTRRRDTTEPSRHTSHRRSTEWTGELSGSTPGTSPNRVDTQAIAAQLNHQELSGTTHERSPSRISKRAVGQAAAELTRCRTGTLPNRVGVQAVAEPNLQVSCQAGSRAGHQTESTHQPSPSRIVRRAVSQDATVPTRRRTGTLPNRVDVQAVAEVNRQATCQSGRRRTDSPPNRHSA
jgi:hypothetical protein